jgi:methylated-DNA-[protein]-cysteine S-methyltransferase
MNYSELMTPFGPIGLYWQPHLLERVLLAPERGRASEPAPDWISAELGAYFADPQHRMVCPIAPRGSTFQHRVWEQIAAIPAGRTRTYGALAAELGSSARAVGGACRANPVPLRVPCHRVVAANGLGGFAADRSGRLVAIKHWLLRHEARDDIREAGA